MLNLIVLGLIPGTNVQLTLTWVLLLMILDAVAAIILFDRRHVQAYLKKLGLKLMHLVQHQPAQ